MLDVVADTLDAGAVVARAYRLDRIVGEGGMGVVWAAHEIRTGRAVALKFLRADARDAKIRERFLREARAAMALEHPHIARALAVLETDVGVPFLVMELLEGESLRALLRRRGTLGPEEAARIFLPILDAVAFAHSKGIVHRDLKPENVFLVRGVDVRVLDFGIAKQLAYAEATQQASLTSTGALVGTPVYMAPEQLFGDDVDARADVWALGVLLYECLAGQRPTEGSGIGPIIKRITTEPLTPLEQVRPGLPPRIARIASRMLLRERADRPSLDEVRAALANADEEPVATARMPSIATAPARAPIAPAAGSETTRIRSQMELASALAIVASCVGLLLFFTPIALVGLVLGFRTRSLARRAGVTAPLGGTLGLAVGGIGTVVFLVFLPWALLGIREDRARTDARTTALEESIGDRAAATTLDASTACAVAELFVRRNGWEREHVIGTGVRDFDCAGRLTIAGENAMLEDVHVATDTKRVTAHACFRHGAAKWYVTELRRDACP